MRFWRKSLRARLTTFFIFFLLISGVFLGALVYWQSRVALQEDVRRRLETAATLKENEINRWLVAKEQEVTRLAQSPELKTSAKNLLTSDKSDPAVQTDYESLSSYLNGILPESPDLMQIAILDRNGQVVFSTDPAQEGQFHVTDTFFIEGLKDTFVQNVYFLPAINRTTITIASPLGKEKGLAVGVLVVHLNLDQLDEIVLNRAGLGETGETYLVDSLNVFISQEGIDLAAFPRGVHTEGIERALAGENGSASYLNYNGVPVIGVYRWLADQDMALLAEIERSEALAPANQLGLTITFITALVILLGSLGGYLTAHQITQPVAAIVETVAQVAEGNLEQQVPVMTKDEIGVLAETFNSMTTQLRQFIGSLEDQIRERTSELALSMEVGQRASTIRDLNVLLPTVTEFIWDQFSLYYVQVFLVDDIGQNLVLRAGTGPVGQQLLAQGHTIPIASYMSLVERAKESLVVGRLRRMPAGYYASIVGNVAVEGEPVIVPDTAESKFFKPDPLLPETRSELAIPLVVEDRVIGVLDMQANEANTFTTENLTVFEAMAVQFAISIDSARQWTIAQEAQQRAEKALQLLTREAWADRLISSWGEEGFAYDLSTIRPLSDVAWVSDNNVSVPLVVQDQAIGQLNINAPERDLTADEQALLQAVAQQLSQKAENLRLFEATQQRASREQIARRIIDKVRASRNIEMALKTAADELNRALGTARASIDLQFAPSSPAEESAGETEDVDPANSVEPPIPANGKQAEETPLNLGEDLE